MIDRIIGNRYKILRQIGSGGMAWVYLAEDTATGAEVAVKVLFPQYAEDSAYTQRFIREAKVAMSLSEPHIVKVLDYGADRDTHYLVMEYIQGRDVKNVLQEDGPLSVTQVLDVAAQVALALQHAHERGIVHRDIKPQNLMITPAGMVKLLDLGIARVQSLPSLTQSGFVGSLYYISPEQAMGGRTDIRSDIYSLGIVMYEMLTGIPPFSADTPWMIVNLHISGQVVPLSQRRSDIPEEVEWLIKKAMAKDPQDRFQTPSELTEAVEWVSRGAQAHYARGARRGAAVPGQTADQLYRRAVEFAGAGRWQQAVDLFGQVLTQDPNYKDVTARLAEAMQQARLETLYSEAQRLLRSQEQKKAAELLMEISATDPNYRDVTELLAKAGAAMEDADVRRHKERAVVLYGRGLMHYGAREWREARSLFEEVASLLPHYRDADTLLTIVNQRLAEQPGEAHAAEALAPPAAPAPAAPAAPPAAAARKPAPAEPQKPSPAAPSPPGPAEPAEPGPAPERPSGPAPAAGLSRRTIILIGLAALLALLVVVSVGFAAWSGALTPAPATSTPSSTPTSPPPSVTPVPPVTRTPTSTPQPTTTPTATSVPTAAATPTPTATATPVLPTQTPTFKYRAPQLISPKNGQGYAGGPLRWGDLQLAGNEYYHVIIYFRQNGAGKFEGANASGYELFLKPTLPSADDDRYEWSVQVMRRTSGSGPSGSDWQGVPISPSSEVWVVIWSH